MDQSTRNSLKHLIQKALQPADHFPHKIQVIPTNSQWFGVTYKEDAPIVKKSLDSLVDDGVYPESLWA